MLISLKNITLGLILILVVTRAFPEKTGLVLETSKTHTTDLVVFSYNRPLQLYAYLESVKKYITGLQNIYLLYRSGDNDFELAFQAVFKAFPGVKTFRQMSNPPQISFKPLLLDIIFKQSQSDYVLFGVDDNVVTNFIDLRTCIQALESSGAYGFYLSLGKNVTQCYTVSVDQDYKLPPFKTVTPEIITWKFEDGLYYWNYPHCFDMTIFRKIDIKDALFTLDYNSPNSLDQAWYYKPGDAQKKSGLCFASSKMINIPINMVQETPSGKYTRNTELATPKELLEIFSEELKIDIAPFHGYIGQSLHVPLTPTFIKRTKVC